LLTPTPATSVPTSMPRFSLRTPARLLALLAFPGLLAPLATAAEPSAPRARVALVMEVLDGPPRAGKPTLVWVGLKNTSAKAIEFWAPGGPAHAIHYADGSSEGYQGRIYASGCKPGVPHTRRLLPGETFFTLYRFAPKKTGRARVEFSYRVERVGPDGTCLGEFIEAEGKMNLTIAAP
jgi:hypothetical protein